MVLIRDILNRILWHPEECADDYVILFIHRGAPNDVKMVSASSILHVNPQSFDFCIGDDYGHIPFHRIVEIRDVKRDKVVWRSRRNGATTILGDSIVSYS